MQEDYNLSFLIQIKLNPIEIDLNKAFIVKYQVLSIEIIILSI